MYCIHQGNDRDGEHSRKSCVIDCRQDWCLGGDDVVEVGAD